MSEHLVREAEEALFHIPVTVVSQGAEALVFESETHPYMGGNGERNERCIIKYRPSKPYRHHKIDSYITRSRTVGEVRFMHKLKILGLNAPAVILTDYNRGIIWMEKVGQVLSNGEISSLKSWLWLIETLGQDCESETVQQMCFAVGALIGKLHLHDMIHGDLTSSNIVLQDSEPFLIDFGLSSYSSLPEDKAVDLYVLERAINSTHATFSNKYNNWLLDGYKNIYNDKTYDKQGPKKLGEVVKKLEEVRLRGRKRSMLG